MKLTTVQKLSAIWASVLAGGWVVALGSGVLAASCPPKPEPTAEPPDTVEFAMTTIPRGKLSPECPKAPCVGMQFHVCVFAWLPQDTINEFINEMPQIPACDSLFKANFE